MYSRDRSYPDPVRQKAFRQVVDLRRTHREDLGATGLRKAFTVGPKHTETDQGLYGALDSCSDLKILSYDDSVKFGARIARLGGFVSSLRAYEEGSGNTVYIPQPRRAEVFKIGGLSSDWVDTCGKFYTTLNAYQKGLRDIAESGEQAELIELYELAKPACQAIAPELWLPEDEQLPVEASPAAHLQGIGKYLDVLVDSFRDTANYV